MAEPSLNTQTERIYRKHHEAKIVRRIVFITLLLIIILIGTITTSGYLYVKSGLEPINPDSTEKTEVTIPIGSSTTAIAKILEENGLIKNHLIFKYYVKYKNETGFQAGNYALSKSMSMQEIIDSIKDGKVYQNVELKITVPEGLRIPEVVKRIADKTDYTEEELLEKMQDRDYIKTLVEKYPIDEKVLDKNIIWPLEGYLFPATYQFTEKKPTLDEILGEMIKKTFSVVNKYNQYLEESKYSIHEILTLASIIEEEARSPEDRLLVSGVFHNRLDGGIALGSDVTVTYANKMQTVLVSTEDTQVDSPYNTYNITGLPIGPISNPSESSILAALQPEKTDALYFYARPNGEVIFNKTLTDHINTKNEYSHEWLELVENQD
jgi:UPF0755 protein